MDDYGRHWLHTLRRGGYRSTLVGVEHISADPAVIGCDEVVDVGSDHAEDVAPRAIEALRAASTTRPWFMSVGFSETHRRFFSPTSIRDVLYSFPPPNLPNPAATRADIVGFKTSARCLDHGVGAVLRGLHELGLADRTLVICTTDHGVAFPGAKATLYDRGMSSVPVEADWRVVDRPTRFAVLDRNVNRRLGRWPQITCGLFDRTVRRPRWLNFQLAVCHTRDVETRLLMILWHLACRWGRVRGDGLLVDLQLSHQTLSEIVGARRPTVTSALGKLREDGKLKPVAEGGWLLLGDPHGFVRRPALEGSEAVGAN